MKNFEIYQIINNKRFCIYYYFTRYLLNLKDFHNINLYNFLTGGRHDNSKIIPKKIREWPAKYGGKGLLQFL